MLDTIPFTSVHSNLEHGLAILTQRALQPNYKAAGLMVHGRSTGLPGIIPKISKKTAIQNDLQTTFCMAAGHMAAL